MGGGNNSKNPFLPNFNMHLLPIQPLTRLFLKTPLVPEFGGLKILFPDLRRVVDLGRVVSDPDTKLDSEAGSDHQNNRKCHCRCIMDSLSLFLAAKRSFINHSRKKGGKKVSLSEAITFTIYIYI